MLAQEFTDWELIVVDDCSSDGTSDWLDTLDHERIRTLRRPQREERSGARNAGLAEARADAVLFLDDDDRLTPIALGRLLQALRGHPDAFGAVGARIAFGGDGRYRYPFPKWPVVRAAWREVLAGWVATPGQMLLRTEVLRAAGGWALGVVPAEDVDLWLRMGEVRAVFVPAAVLEYRIHEGARDAADVDAIEAGLRTQFVGAQIGRAQRAAANHVAARTAIRQSDVAFRRAEFSSALASLRSALRLAPDLFFSPLLGPSLLWSVVKAVGGSLLGPWAGPARARVRRARAAQGRAGLPS